MSSSAIALENIGKVYRIGRPAPSSSFREAFTGIVGSTLRRIRGFGEDRANFQEFWALKDINFSIQQGEAVGIIGRNGAGKSTLLKILSRITEPSEGIARIRGRVASLLEVGTGFHPDLTGRENIFLNGSILGMKRSEIARKFDEIVAFSEVERFLDTPVKRYSSGMYIRLAFAVAAHLEPEVLLVDEVLAVGDVEFQKKCLGKMNEVVGHGRTVFFVSHNMQSIASLTSRCLVFKNGRLLIDGPSEQAIRTFIDLASEGTRQGKPYIRVDGRPDDNYVAEARVITSESFGQQTHGKPLAFEFVLHIGLPQSSLFFAFSLVDNMGVRSTHLWMSDPEAPFCSRSGDFRLRVTIPRCRLYRGTYTLSILLKEWRGKHHYDDLNEICPFEVEMGALTRFDQWTDDPCVYLDDVDWEPIAEMGSA